MKHRYLSGETKESAGFRSGFYYAFDAEGTRLPNVVVVNEKFPPLDGHFELAMSDEDFELNTILQDALKAVEMLKRLVALAREAMEELPEDVGPAALSDTLEEAEALIGVKTNDEKEVAAGEGSQRDPGDEAEGV